MMIIVYMYHERYDIIIILLYHCIDTLLCFCGYLGNLCYNYKKIQGCTECRLSFTIYTMYAATEIFRKFIHLQP
jgi:hypothetical protein